MLHQIQKLSIEETRLIHSDAMRVILGEDKRNEFQNSDFQEEAQMQTVLSPEKCLFFDIETTGLSADTSFIFLIGCICFDGCDWNLHQFLIQQVQEERTLLSSFSDLVSLYPFLVHFNGKTFDLPFLQKRAAANALAKPIPENLTSVDLYQHFRPLAKLLLLPHRNQRFLENYVGWERKDQLSGKEVVRVFWDYTVSGNPENRRKNEALLLGHNRDDLTGMLHILCLEGYLSLTEGNIQPGAAARLSDDQNTLLIQFELSLSLPQPYLYPLQAAAETDEPVPTTAAASIRPAKAGAVPSSADLPGIFTLQVNGSSGQLAIPVHSGMFRYFFPDYKNYYYLPLEKQAIHKSVASYVAKEYRVPAKPENCYAEKQGLFLPVPGYSLSDDRFSFLRETILFRKSYETNTHYFEYKDDICEKKAFIDSYVRVLLQSVKP